jgi:hypothetical protein
MVSPLVELSQKNLRGKAFRFGIFRGPISAMSAAIVLVFATEISRNRIVGCDVALWRGPVETDGVMRILFCEPTLGKVGSGWSGCNESFPVL